MKSQKGMLLQKQSDLGLHVLYGFWQAISLRNLEQSS